MDEGADYNEISTEESSDEGLSSNGSSYNGADANMPTTYDATQSWRSSPLVQTSFEDSPNEYQRKWPGDEAEVSTEESEDEIDIDDDGFVVNESADNNEPDWAAYMSSGSSSSIDNGSQAVWNVTNMFQYGFRINTPSNDDEQLSLLDDDAKKLMEGSLELGQDMMSYRVKELLQRFLLLESPRITSQMLDFFLMDSVLDNLLKFVSRVENRLLKSGHWTRIGVKERILLCSNREREQEEDLPQKLSYQVTQLFASTAPAATRLLDLKLREIVIRLFDIFHPESNGNFYHFNKLIGSLLQQCPNPVLDLLLTPMSHKVNYYNEASSVDNIHVREMGHSRNASNVSAVSDDFMLVEKPLIFLALPFIQITSVQDAVLSILSFRQMNSNETHETLQRKRLALLQQEEFLEEILEIILIEKHQDLLQNQIIGASDFLLKWIEDACDYNGGNIPFKTLEGDKRWISRIVKLMCSSSATEAQKSVLIDILHGLCVRAYRRPLKLPIVSMDDLAAGQLKKPPTPKSELHFVAQASCKYLLDHLKQLIDLVMKESLSTVSTEEPEIKLSGYVVKKPFHLWRIMLLEIIHEALEVLVDENSIDMAEKARKEKLACLDAKFWQKLTDWFFEYSHNNTYHSVYYKLIRLLLESNDEKCLKIIIEDCKIVPRMIKEFKTGKSIGCGGHIILIFNVLRLMGEYLDAEDSLPKYLRSSIEWAEFWPVLKEQTLRQVISVAPIIDGSPANIPTPHFAPDVIQLESSESDDSSTPKRPSSRELIDGVHLGSACKLRFIYR